MKAPAPKAILSIIGYEPNLESVVYVSVVLNNVLCKPKLASVVQGSSIFPELYNSSELSACAK